MCRNHRGCIEAMVAAGTLGADLLLLNSELPAIQLEQVLAWHQITALVCDEEFAFALDTAGYSGTRMFAWTESGNAGATVDGLIS